MFGSGEHTGSSYLAIVSASLTPAILILATGSLVMSTLQRLTRVVDRARALIDAIGELRERGGEEERIRIEAMWLRTYARRAALTERALNFFYIAIGLFVASSLAITIDSLTHDSLPWLSLALVVFGALLLFAGTSALVIETNVATGTLNAEIEASCESILEPSGPIPAGLARLVRLK
jgi:hypothetical protein